MNETNACSEVREGLTEYLEGALPPDRRQGFREHLASCAGCRRIHDQILSAIEATSALPREPMPARMKERLLRALRDTPR